MTRSELLLPGLNTLRFVAAFFVVISHGNIALIKLGVYQQNTLAFFNRGGDAVEFFFTLSGFLITYLLIRELQATGTVSVRKFYLRRVFRIWPLYFLIVAVGFILLGVIYPRMYGQPFFAFNWWKGLLLFLCFMPNYMSKNYAVGVLNPLWSIGVEEQFYLFWAPFIKYVRAHLFPGILFFLVFSIIAYGVVYYRLIPMPMHWNNFFLTQKFYAMAIGSLFGYMLFFGAAAYDRSLMARKWFQAIVLFCLTWHYVFNPSVETGLPGRVLLCMLYGLLILNVSSISHKLINLENPFLSYLGTISFGIYMYHLLVDYMLRSFSPQLLEMNVFSNTQFIILYHACLLVFTVLLSAFSYRYFERFFLRLKSRYSVNTKSA
jgi:peptidoglycan/LPS O-acetylase OafA/YrhL